MSTTCQSFHNFNYNFYQRKKLWGKMCPLIGIVPLLSFFPQRFIIPPSSLPQLTLSLLQSWFGNSVLEGFTVGWSLHLYWNRIRYKQDIEIFPPSVFAPPLSTLKLIWKQPPWWVHHWDRNPEWGYWRFHLNFMERNHHHCSNPPAHQNSQSNNISQESKPNVQLSTSSHNSKSIGEQQWNTTSRFFKTNF